MQVPCFLVPVSMTTLVPGGNLLWVGCCRHSFTMSVVAELVIAVCATVAEIWSEEVSEMSGRGGSESCKEEE